MNQITSMNTPLPHNTEAEQQVLGAILADPRRVEIVEAKGGEKLFYDPLHADIFKFTLKRHRANMLVSPVALRGWASVHPGMKDVGGAQYLVRLVGNSISGNQIEAYSDMLADDVSRRKLIEALNRAQHDLIHAEDPPHVIAGRLEANLQEVEVPQDDRPVSMTKAATIALEQVSRAKDGDRSDAVTTGYYSIDRLFSGFHPGELVLLGGRPGMGKTAVALSIATSVARRGGGVCIASLEMNPEAMAIRAISEETGRQNHAVTYEGMRRGELTDMQMGYVADATRAVAGLPIHFLSRRHSSLGALLSGARQAHRIMGGMKLLVIDYAQLLQSDARSRTEEITKISMALKNLAGQLNVPVLALSQLSRQVESREDKRPMLSDLRESGQLEQDADAVIFAFREEYYLQNAEPDINDEGRHEQWEAKREKARNRLELIIAKQRQGRVGTVDMRCNVALNRIWEA